MRLPSREKTRASPRRDDEGLPWATSQVDVLPREPDASSSPSGLEGQANARSAVAGEKCADCRAPCPRDKCRRLPWPRRDAFRPATTRARKCGSPSGGLQWRFRRGENIHAIVGGDGNMVCSGTKPKRPRADPDSCGHFDFVAKSNTVINPCASASPKLILSASGQKDMPAMTRLVASKPEVPGAVLARLNPRSPSRPQRIGGELFCHPTERHAAHRLISASAEFLCLQGLQTVPSFRLQQRPRRWRSRRRAFQCGVQLHLIRPTRDGL